MHYLLRYSNFHDVKIFQKCSRVSYILVKLNRRMTSHQFCIVPVLYQSHFIIYKLRYHKLPNLCVSLFIFFFFVRCMLVCASFCRMPKTLVMTSSSDRWLFAKSVNCTKRKRKLMKLYRVAQIKRYKLFSQKLMKISTPFLL